MPTYISDLNSSEPQGTDPVSGGDDKLREIQLALLDTFANVTGAVTSNHAELNLLDGLTGPTGVGNLVASSAPTFSGVVAMTGSLTVTGTITGSIDAGEIDSGTLADARVAESNVTQHQAALSVTESQISDLGTYLPTSGGTLANANIGSADTTLTRVGAGVIGLEGKPVLVHDSASYSSAKVFFSNGTEPTTEGSNGDIFLVY